MKFIFKVLMAFAVLLVLFLVVGMMLPERLQVERSIEIQAESAEVYPYVSDFRLFRQWSPWAAMDPLTTYSFEGPQQGEGAIMHWRSEHPEVGMGSQKIVQASPGKEVRSVLAFGGMGKAYSTFRLQAMQGSTRLSWNFDMRFAYNIPGRILGLLMKDGIAENYDRGLLNLKQLIEQQQASL